MSVKRSAAFMLFHKWVAWRVPEWTTITQYMSQEHGLFLPDDEKKARAILLNKKTVYMRPFEVAVYAETGAALDVHDPSLRVYHGTPSRLVTLHARASSDDA